METENKYLHKNKVHKILAHSYSVYLIFLLIGVCLDVFFSFKIFDNSFVAYIGVLFLMLGAVLIFWAQKTSRNFKKNIINKEMFYHGPYRFTRTPTNFGLFFLMLGFGLVVNAFFIVLFAFICFILGKFVFLDKQEKILEEKYGAPYIEYKKLVKF